jgi:outer membrane receptor protein involved in Fe transport
MRKLHCLLVGILLLIGEGLLAQTTMEVSGKITDPTGGPIPNATIRIKSTKTSSGTSADASGGFALKVKPGTELIVSAIGFETKEVRVGSSPTLSISLNTDSKSLSEVVVTGVGVATSKKKLGISVESVTAEKMPAAPTASVDQALIGKIPGAQISSVSGLPGANVNILLRGINTLQSGTMPMILLDGVQLYATSLNTIDLSTIERVEVVQGAASAALYGAQGANGVIQLFSKKGKQGKVNIDVSSNVTNNTYLNIGHVHKAQLHSFEVDGSNNVLGSDGNPLTQDPATGLYSYNVVWNSTDPTNINNKAYNANLKYYDHFKEFFKSANTVNNSIAISGASNKTDFFISASNNYQVTNFKDDGYYSRNNFSANIGTEIFKGLKFRSITQLAYTRNTVISDQGFIYELNNSQPFSNYEFKDLNGNFAKKYGNAAGQNGSNPNYDTYYEHQLENRLDLVENLDLDYKFPKFVDLDVKYGLNYQDDPSSRTYANQSANANAGVVNNAINPTDLITTPTNGHYVSHQAMINAANNCFDSAITLVKSISDSGTFTSLIGTLIPSIFQVGLGGAFTPSMFVRNVNTYLARNILLNNNLSTISAAQWDSVLNYTNAGIQQGDYVFTARSDNNSTFMGAGGNLPAEAVGDPNNTASFQIMERLIQEFYPGDYRFNNNFSLSTTGVFTYSDRSEAGGTRWQLLDGDPAASTGDSALVLFPDSAAKYAGTIVYANTAVGAYELYLAGTYEENELMKAEALINTGSIDPGLTHVDNVRNYQGANLAPTSGTGLTLAQAKEVVRRERRIALMFRGFAFYDARREGYIYNSTNGGGRTGCVLIDGSGNVQTNVFINYNYLDYWDVPGNETAYNPASSGSAAIINPQQ